jgi:hypothetical protein
MPRPLPAFVLAAAVPLLGLALHAGTTHAAGMPASHPAAILPNNLCSQCHGGHGIVPTAGALGARELAATRDYLRVPPRG